MSDTLRGRETLASIGEDLGDRVLTVTCDVSDSHSVQRAIADVVRAFGSINIQAAVCCVQPIRFSARHGRIDEPSAETA